MNVDAANVNRMRHTTRVKPLVRQAVSRSTLRQRTTYGSLRLQYSGAPKKQQTLAWLTAHARRLVRAMRASPQRCFFLAVYLCAIRYCDGRVLACLFGPDRATDSTFSSFLTYVVNPLDADVCGAVSSRRQHAAHWHAAAVVLRVYTEVLNQSSAVSLLAAQLAINTSAAHVLHDNYLRPRGFHDMYAKNQLLLAVRPVLKDYDWFYFGRTDLMYLAPVLDLGSLSTETVVWIPFAGTTSDRHGLYDDAALVPREHVETFLGQLNATVAPGADETFLRQVQPLPGTEGHGTSAQHFLLQYLAFRGVPVKRFDFTAYTVGVLRDGGSTAHVNLDTGHIYRHTNQYLNAVHHALAFYSRLHSSDGTEPSKLSAVEPGQSRRFYVITMEQAERINATLKGCGISAWGSAVYEHLLSHPLRTKHVAHASVAFMPPHFAWDLHWPVQNGNRDGNIARKDSNYPLPKEDGGYEPYGSALATSCRSWYSPCGYEGCVPEFGRNALANGLAEGRILSRDGVLAVMSQLFEAASLNEGTQKLVFYDSGSPGPVAYQNQSDSVGGYDLPARAYGDDRFIFALASSLERFFRPGLDASMPTPWTEDVSRYKFMLAPNKSFFLTFKGSFQTTAGRHGNDLRSRVASVLHNPDDKIIVVDKDSTEGQAYDYKQLLHDTVFTLILRGDQPYSYRYTEAVCSGAVPVMVLSGGWVLPFSNLHPFTDYGVIATEDELPKLVARLRAMPEQEVERLRYAAKQFCLEHLVTVHAQVDSLVMAVLSQTTA